MNPGIIEIKDAVSDARVKVKADQASENAIVVTTNRLGQALTSSSHPIVIASNQSSSADQGYYTNIVGNIPSGNTDSGNPVKVSGVYFTTLQTLADGQVGELNIDTKGALRVTLASYNQTGSTVCSSSAYDTIVDKTALYTSHQQGRFNGTTWDKERNNIEGILLASATRTANTQSPTQTNYNSDNLKLIVNVTSIVGSPNLHMRVQGIVTSASSTWYYVDTTGFMINTITTKIYDVGPRIYYISGSCAQAPLPRSWRLEILGPTTGSITYSVGMCVN